MITHFLSRLLLLKIYCTYSVEVLILINNIAVPVTNHSKNRKICSGDKLTSPRNKLGLVLF